MPPSRKAVVIRSPEFARRFADACGAHPHCPPVNQGRLRWIQEEFVHKFDVPVTQETVRKWLAGEVKPKQDKMSKLAKILNTSEEWLALGIKSDLEPRERKVRNAMADGAVNVVAGLIQMDGGHPAFPDKNDADQAYIDLHAIIRGAKYDFHVCLADTSGDKVKFVVPPNYDSVIQIGLIKYDFDFDVFEISPEDVERYGSNRGGGFEVVLDDPEKQLRRIESFTQRL